jgi:hypothetical protein
MTTDRPARTGTRRYVLSAVAGAGGLALFAYAIAQAGTGEILAGIRRVGWGLPVILALGGVRFLLRTASWRLCMPPRSRVPFRQAFQAFLAGDAIGNVTPLGLIASEPTKVFLMRHELVTGQSVASLAVDNIVYGASVLSMVLVGLFVLLLPPSLGGTVSLPFVWSEAALVIIVVLVVAGGIAARLLLRGAWDDGRGERPKWRQKLAGLRQSVLAFSAGHPSRVWRVFALHMTFHAVAVIEVFLTLGWLLDRPPTWSVALMFSALDRVMTAVFKFVPLRAGVDEASSGALAPLLGIDATVGVTLAVVRKVRNLAWALAGMLIIAAHPAREAPGRGPRGSAFEPRP